jgi:hypothetical protein
MKDLSLIEKDVGQPITNYIQNLPKKSKKINHIKTMDFQFLTLN